MKKILWSLLLLLGLLQIVIVIKTFAFKSLQAESQTIDFPVFGDSSVGHMSEAVSFPTVSTEIDAPIDTVVFEGFRKFLEEACPLTHSNLKKEVFSSFSLLLTWEGKDLSLKPVILTAHMDVVPAGEVGSWSHPPFSGDNDGTYIWGMGTNDDKASLISIMEAVEKLLSEGYQPDRTVYLAFGHDEELSGMRGAGVIAEALDFIINSLRTA